MNRRKYLGIAGGLISIGGITYYLSSDKENFTRAEAKQDDKGTIAMRPDEKEILFVASLAPSGHNTQPWFVKYIEPYHWIIGNDKSKWLPAVDPTQRETILSIGAFVQNLEYAANSLGYACQSDVLATTNQDEDMIDVVLIKFNSIGTYDTKK